MRTHAKLSVFPLLCGTLLLCGCLDAYHFVDYNRPIRTGHILDRRYILTENRRLPLAVFHLWLEPDASYRPPPDIDVAAGTFLRTVHVEEKNTFESSSDVILASIENGADAGRSVVIGVAGFDRFNDLDLPATFLLSLAYVRSGESDLEAVLFPYPSYPPPPWLDLHPPDTQPSRARPFVPPPQARPTSTRVLADALRNPDWAVRYYAVMGIGDRWLTDAVGAHALEIALCDQDFGVRSAAAGLIRRNPSASRASVFADDIEAALIHTLTCSNLSEPRLEELRSALVVLGPRVIPAMIKIVDAHQPHTIFWAAHVIGELRPDAAQCLPILARAVPFDRGMPSKEVWAGSRSPSSVVWAMGEIDPLASSDLLVPMLRDKSPLVREACAYGLWDLWLRITEINRANPAAAARATEGLIPLLDDPDQLVVWFTLGALKHLARFGQAPPSAQHAIESFEKRYPERNGS
jgi:hypothetical protein